MDKDSVRGCPVCEAVPCEVLHTQRFVFPDDSPLPRQYDLVCCRGCGFVYADVAVTQQTYDAYYASQSIYAAPSSPYDAKRHADTAAAIMAFTPESANILDVGCATGGLLTALRDAGAGDRLVGVDLSPACVDAVRHRGFHAEVGSFSALPSFAKPFDCVVLSHVLEHLVNPRAALSAAAGLLAPHGVVYVEVPDAMRYGEFLTEPMADVNGEHLGHHSDSTLDNLGMECGLETDWVQWKVLETPTPYPAMFAFFRRRIGPKLSRRPEPRLRARMESYVARSRDMLARIDARLRGVSGPVVVWGAGQFTYRLLADTCLGDGRVAAFIDANPVHQGRRLCGLPIRPPERLRDYPHPVVVASMRHERAVVERIREMSLPNEVITLAHG